MDHTLIQLRQTVRRSRVFNLIQQNNEQLSRFDICKLTRYSTTTVTAIVDGLVEEGLVIEDASKESRVGRRPSLLRVNGGSLYFLGIECSSTGVNLTVINAMRERVIHRTVPLNLLDTKDILDAMRRLLDNFAAEQPDIWEKVPILAFSIPGALQEETGLAIQYRTVPDWNHLDFRALFSYLGKQMLFINNVDAMLTGYRLQQQLPPEQSVMFTILRNSAGVRLFSQGMLLSKAGVVCEAGHMRVPGSTRRCVCGKKGCYDAEISQNAVVNKLREAHSAGLLRRELPEEGINLQTFLRLVEEGEPVAMDIFSETCEYICRMLETLFSFFRPDVAVLSTYLNDQQQLLEQRIWKHLAQWDPEFHPNLVFIPPANELASFGAAVAGYDAVFPVPTSEP